MKLAAVVLGFAVLAAPAFAEPGPTEGGVVYETRCKMCHGTGMANAPLIDYLAKLENSAILKALNDPAPMMAGAIAGLTDQDKRNVAVFLTKKTLPASGDLPEVKAE